MLLHHHAVAGALQPHHHDVYYSAAGLTSPVVFAGVRGAMGACIDGRHGIMRASRDGLTRATGQAASRKMTSCTYVRGTRTPGLESLLLRLGLAAPSMQCSQQGGGVQRCAAIIILLPSMACSAVQGSSPEEASRHCFACRCRQTGRGLVRSRHRSRPSVAGEHSPLWRRWGRKDDQRVVVPRRWGSGRLILGRELLLVRGFEHLAAGQQFYKCLILSNLASRVYCTAIGCELTRRIWILTLVPQFLL